MKKEERGYQEALRLAAEGKDPESEKAREACARHLAWLRYTWGAESCTPEAHISLVEMYIQDPRFVEYYDRIVPDGAEFLGKAIHAYYGR